MVLVYPIKPTLISKICLYDPQQLIIGIYHICSRNGGSYHLISIFSLQEINVKHRIQWNNFKPSFPQDWDLCRNNYFPFSHQEYDPNNYFLDTILVEEKILCKLLVISLNFITQQNVPHLLKRNFEHRIYVHQTKFLWLIP